MKRTVLEMLSAAAELYADNIYVCDKTSDGWCGLTFSQVEKYSSAFAVALIKEGVTEGDRVAVISEGSSRWIISEYAVLKAKAVCVPLSVKLQPSEIEFRIEHSGTKYVFVSKNCINVAVNLKEKNLKVVYLDDKDSDFDKISSTLPGMLLYGDMLDFGLKNFQQYEGILKTRLAAVEENDPATISYTSGTTGNPKGIMLSHLNYWANAHDAVQYFRLENFLTLFVVLPLDHSFAHTVGFFCATLCSMKLCFVDARGGMRNMLKNISPNILEVKPDFMLTVPAVTGNFMKKIKEGVNKKGGFAKWLFYAGIKNGSMYFGDGFQKPSLLKQIFCYPIYRLADKLVFSEIRKMFGGNLKFFIGGGAMLEVKQQQFFNCIGIPVMQGYGQSEASPIISVNQRHRHKFGSSGGVLSGIDCKILDSDGNELPAGKKGVITVKGLNVMKGYFGNEKATAEVLSNGRLNTGDLGYIDSDGFLFVTGREKALLISFDGEKYSPEEIEDAIVTCSDFIFQCVLYNDHCKYTTAVITLDNQVVKRYAKEHGISSAEKMFEIVKKSFYAFKSDDTYKNKFPQQWIPTVFAVLPEPFTEQNKMLNSTMKIIRFQVLKNYKDKIDKMYTLDGKTDNSENIKIIQKIMENIVVEKN